MKTMWTALIGAIVALLAAMGFAAPASAATAPAPTDNNSSAGGAADTRQSSTAPVGARQHSPLDGQVADASPSARWSMEGLTRSVPPTMKQRIRAEAHGGSPRVRQVPAMDRTQSGVRDDYEAVA
ncbi:DUF6344 domain-containing protein [Streptomyces sp. CA-294286]|uniref:DUF6344 domain-containing protein n=1 Tax=Streptomyces sp. CA-294286 TaxID=3240070 RepID=UPI003D8E6B17